MSVIRKKPYVEKVVESLSDTSLELLRETLNTNKENVNCSLIGGNNLLKRFKKEYKGAVLSDGEGTLYINFDLTYDKVNEMFESLLFMETPTAKVVILGNDSPGLTSIGLSKTKTTSGYSKSIALSIGDTPDYYTYAYFYNEEEFEGYKESGEKTGTWEGEGWYQLIIDDSELVKISGIQVINNCIFDAIKESDAKKVTELFSFNTPFVSSNTELQGHIPAVGDKIEKVYFNPNAYSTDAEWMLWYESLKQVYNELDHEWAGATVINWEKSALSQGADNVNNTFPLTGVGTLDNILTFSMAENFFLYVSNDALTGTYAAVYASFGITENGWYKVIVNGGTPTEVTKVSDIIELTPFDTDYNYIVLEGGWGVFEVNNHLFAKVVSYNTPFVETPIQNNLKPAVASAGETLNKIYINLGYFDNDLNKGKEYWGGANPTILFKYKDSENNTNEFGFNYTASADTTTINFDITSNATSSLMYLSQSVVAYNSLEQDLVNKWALIRVSGEEFEILDVIDTDVYELPLEGTITEIDDLSLISVNKPFTEISGWIYDEVTPVNLQLEQNNLKTGILVWNDDYCSLFAYHRFQDMKEYELDPENSYFKVINEDLSINELRRIAFTPTQEATVEVTTKYSQAIELEMRVVPTGSEGYCGVLYQCILNLEDFLKGLSAAFYNLSGVTVEITSAAQLNTLLGLLDSSTLIQAMIMIAGVGAQRTEAKSYFINYDPNDGDAEPNVMTLLSAGYLSDLIFIDKTKIIGTLSSAFTTILGDGFAFDEAIIRVDNVSIE